MTDSQDLIDFNVIESHKENIQALPSGRSAKALAQLYSPPLLGVNQSPVLSNDANSKTRAEFEKELALIEEVDDPLDIYDRYVKWTLDAYPSTQATPQSQLLPLLERATKAFQSSAHYKNDPRYLKLWLHYIRLFSDAPREVFVFLARHGIGDGLALYFEEFAAWLENAGRWNQAEEIYRMGIDKGARPVERLLRKFGEFERRKDARPAESAEPSSPALPAVRPALAAKMDPFASSSPSNPQQSSSSGSKKSKSTKMTIFSDSDAPSRPESNSSSKGWDSIGSVSERRKENSMEAKPWAGEKLKTGKTNGGMQKMMIFKDSSSRKASIPKHFSKRGERSNHESQCVRNPKNGRLECVFVSLEAVYPDAGRSSVEYCFEELRAQHRGLLNKDWKKPKASEAATQQAGSVDAMALDDLVSMQQTTQQRIESKVKTDVEQPRTTERSFKIFEDLHVEAEPKQKIGPTDTKLTIETSMRTLALKDENDENSPPSKEEAEVAPVKKAKREDRGNRTRKIKVMDTKHIKNETKTIQLNMDSPTGPKLKRKKSGDRPEPTMTINTKEAMDEIYGIFNQPLQVHGDQTDAEDDDSEDDDDDYTTGDESTATGKLSAAASEYGDETRNEILTGRKSEDTDRTDNTGWSEFTMSKHAPKDDSLEDGATQSEQTTTQDLTAQSYSSDPLAATRDDDEPRTMYLPIAEEDIDVGIPRLPNHRLPFMTPIVEQTESSLGAGTIRTEKNGYFAVKTPSRNAGIAGLLGDDEEPCSSPFDDVTTDMDEDKKRVLQPIRTKSTKGTISLGQGTAKSQTMANKPDPAAEGTTQKGPIIREAQCNPMDPALRLTILAELKPSLSAFEGYHQNLEMSLGRSAEIKKYVRSMAKAGKGSSGADKTAQTLSLPPVIELEGAHGIYTIKRELGAGTFAPVYLAENSTASSVDESEVQEEDIASRVGRSTHRRALEAIKMEEPPSTWEFFILQQSHRRLGISRPAESIVRAHEMHLFSDECYLIEEYRDQGTLLDLVNIARLEGGSGGGMDETLAMFFTVELLRTVEAMHTKQLIHGDLKGDNVLVRFDDPGPETDWSPTYFPNGAHGWSSKGVCLIDFGRGIDMRHFVPNVAFIADWKTTEADCAEMRELRPWTYQIDYHGLAGIIHSLLFGKYMETIGEKGPAQGILGQGATKTYRIRESLKRYWQTEIWAELFHLLLNPLAHVDREEGKKMPVVRGMKACRERMETWLEENCERGIGLKGTIMRMEGTIREKRRKSVRS